MADSASNPFVLKSGPCYQYSMATDTAILQIRNRRVSDLARRLASLRQSTKTEAVRIALEHELERLEARKSLAEKLRPLQARFAARAPTGLQADKEFFDDLSGDP
jgi:antitoxin VapB